MAEVLDWAVSNSQPEAQGSLCFDSRTQADEPEAAAAEAPMEEDPLKEVAAGKRRKARPKVLQTYLPNSHAPSAHLPPPGTGLQGWRQGARLWRRIRGTGGCGRSRPRALCVPACAVRRLLRAAAGCVMAHC